MLERDAVSEENWGFNAGEKNYSTKNNVDVALVQTWSGGHSEMRGSCLATVMSDLWVSQQPKVKRLGP